MLDILLYLGNGVLCKMMNIINIKNVRTDYLDFRFVCMFVSGHTGFVAELCGCM